MKRSTQRPILKNRPALRLVVALLIVTFFFASAAHTVASATQSDVSAQSNDAAVHSDLAVTRRPPISDHCRVLDVVVTQTLISATPIWCLARSSKWHSKTAIAAPVGYVFQLLRPPKTLPEPV